MSYISLTDKYNCIKGLAAMAKADGIFNMAELTYLLWVANKIGLTKVEVDRILKEVEAEAAVPLSRDQRIEQFHRIQNMVCVDGHIHQDELDHLLDVGTHMQLEEAKLRDVMKDLSEGQTPLSLEEVITRLR